MICGVHGIKNDVYLQFMSRNFVRSHLLIIEERKLCAMHNIERDSIDSSAYPLIYPKEERAGLLGAFVRHQYPDRYSEKGFRQVHINFDL